MQFLFQQIRITKNVNSSQKVEPEDIESLGGVENCLKFAFEESYQELSEVQKNFTKKGFEKSLIVFLEMAEAEGLILRLDEGLWQFLE